MSITGMKSFMGNVMLQHAVEIVLSPEVYTCVTTVLSVTPISMFCISYYKIFGLTRPTSGVYILAKAVALSS
jgi:hypothetical protein